MLVASRASALGSTWHPPSIILRPSCGPADHISPSLRLSIDSSPPPPHPSSPSSSSQFSSPVLPLVGSFQVLPRAKMDSGRRQGGIQLLLAAEQEAQQIVAAARNEKLARLKQAKDEAEKEIKAYRAQMEAEFQRKVAESSGDSGANVKRLEAETEAKIENLNAEAARISHEVGHMLLKYVTTVKN